MRIELRNTDAVYKRCVKCFELIEVLGSDCLDVVSKKSGIRIAGSLFVDNNRRVEDIIKTTGLFGLVVLDENEARYVRQFYELLYPLVNEPSEGSYK